MLVWLILGGGVRGGVAGGEATFDPERGLPLMQRFLPSVYQGHYQVNDLTVAADGRLYGTSQQAVVRYDGTRWERLPFPGLWAWRVAATPDGRVYVGGDDEVGFLADDATGATTYHSLVDQVPAEALPLGSVRGAKAAGGAVAFAAEKGWLVWQDGAFNFTPVGTMHRTYVHAAGERLWASFPNGGLHRWTGQAWEPFGATTALAGATITGVTTWGNDGRLLVLSPGGVMVTVSANGDQAEPWRGIGAEALAALRPLGLLALPDGRIAAFTRQAGLIIAMADGSAITRIDKALGLTSDTAYGLAVDRQNGLWVGGTNGLNRIDLGPGATVFDERNSAGAGGMRSFTRHGGVFYSGVVDSLQRLVPADGATGAPAHFEPVPESPTAINDLATHPEGLLVAAMGGLYRYRPETGFEFLFKREGADISVVWTTPADPKRIYLGADDRLMVAHLDAAGFAVDFETTGAGDAELITPMGADTVWVGTRAAGFFRLRAGEGVGGWAKATVEKMGEAEGLPRTLGYTAAFEAPWGVGFFTGEGMWLWDDATRRFAPEPAFQLGDGAHYGYPGAMDAAGRWWASGGRFVERGNRPLGWYELPTGAARRAATWHLAPAGLQPLAGSTGFLFFYPEARSGTGAVVWGKSPQAVVRLEADRLAGAENPPWRIGLKAVSAAGAAQGLLASDAAGARFAASAERTVFQFVPGRLDGGVVGYRTRLRGWDDSWSDVVAYPEISFTNLEGGPFGLEVVGVDGAGKESEPLRFSFTVTPPWQRTGLARVGFGLVGLALMVGYGRWRLGRSERERRRLEGLVEVRTRDLATARDQAEAASRAKSDFLASMSHELRTPLNGVLGYAQLLQNDARMLDDQRDRLRIVHRSGEHLLRMINDVLDLAKIEAGKIDLRVAPLALADLVSDVMAAHAPAAAAKGLIFRREDGVGLPAWVAGDVQKLRQVLDNLIGNAVKFTATGSVTVTVRLQRGNGGGGGEEGRIEFAVKDTGAGIAPADQARLFQAFEQAREERPLAPGTGLGLAISRGLAARMNGRLELQSELGRGSQFLLSVPLKEAEAVRPAAPARVIMGYEGKRRRVMIVDDHAVNRSLLTDLLSPLGFSCTECASGEDALAKLADGEEAWPDVAIVDLRMAGMDGLELTRRLRRLPRGVELRVLMTSASVISFDPAEALAAGCDDFLPKPFRMEDLIQRLEGMLQLRWLNREFGAEELGASVGGGPIRERMSLPVETRERLGELLAVGDLAALREALSELIRNQPELAESWRKLDQAAADYQLAQLRHWLQ